MFFSPMVPDMGTRVAYSHPMSDQSVALLDSASRLLITFIGCAIVASCCAASNVQEAP